MQLYHGFQFELRPDGSNPIISKQQHVRPYNFCLTNNYTLKEKYMKYYKILWNFYRGTASNSNSSIILLCLWHNLKINYQKTFDVTVTDPAGSCSPPQWQTRHIVDLSPIEDQHKWADMGTQLLGRPPLRLGNPLLRGKSAQIEAHRKLRNFFNRKHQKRLFI